MKFDCKVKIVDMIMGSGKTSSAINYINHSDDDTCFLFITPYLDEVDRIKTSCKNKHFKEPKEIGTKLNGLKYLIERGENIVSTHALFSRFDQEIIDMLRAKNYILIMDEVTDVIEKYEIKPDDFKTLLEKYAYVEEDTGLIKWRDDNYTGDKFIEEKRLCDMNSLAYYGGSVMMWLFPIEVFNSFRKIYILTYMFNSQVQRYYYDYYNLNYDYIYVTGNNFDNYHFTDNINQKQNILYDFKNLINIYEDEKLNMLGDRETDLSKNWYSRNKNNVAIKQLKNNMMNFFANICKTKTSENLWTTFVDYKSYLKGKGYTKGFVPLNMRASNKYKDRISVAYPVNRYLNTGVKNFFLQHNVDVDEDGFAISEMVQFIWRSAIREGNQIQLYIPSIRMRNLLKQWIEDNSNSKNREVYSVSQKHTMEEKLNETISEI